MLNVSWQLFPFDGSFYDPRLALLVYTLVAAMVTVLWGPRTLAEFRIPWSGRLRLWAS